MTTPHPRRTWMRSLVSFVFLAAVALVSAPHNASAAGPYPNSIIATGDSITRAFNSGPTVLSEVPANSWSTGTNTSVNSMYRRILSVNSAISNRAFNLARSGAKVADLNSEMSAAILLSPEYVTVLIGANDVCTSSEATMTSVQDFRTRFQTAMTTLTSSAPNARIFVSSIPNVYNLWSIFKDNASARAAWTSWSTCQSMLANPTSTAQADVDRRARVRQRNIDFNTQLQQVCAQYAKCRFDNNATFNTAFVPSDVSTHDYFHPAIAGQAKLAAVAWAASGL